jgi:hypothetical protein
MNPHRRDRSIASVHTWNLIPPIVTAEMMMVILQDGRSHFDELMAAGMPHLNLGSGTKRKMLRFEPEAVITWLRQRNGNGR